MAQRDNPMYNNEVLDLPAGAVFGGHRIESVVGRGGMGVVYLAVHERLKQRRALKVIAPEYCRDEQFRRRFEREWEVAAAIDHPHVIPIYDAGEDDGQLFIAMRYVDGTDLRSLIAREGRLDPAFTAGVVGQIGSALDAAHARGLVHRDVKPANILIADTAEGAFAYLTDFGLTKEVSAETSGLTKTGVFVGTLDYIAPEQLDGVATSRSDIYALGCLTYHALSGQVPFPQPTAPAKMWAHIHSPPPHLSVGSPGMADAVARAMAKNPNDRFPSAGEFGSALEAAVNRKDLPVTEAAPPEIGAVTVSEERPAMATPVVDPGDTPVTAAGGEWRPSDGAPASKPRPTSRRPIAAAIALAVVLLGGIAAAVISAGGGEAKHSKTTSGGKAANGKAKKGKVVFKTHPFGPVPTPTETIEQGAGNLQAEKGLQGVRSAGFGSGGIVEYSKSAPTDVWNYPMALDRAGHYVPMDHSFRYGTIGLMRSDFDGPDTAAVNFVKAVKNNDCDTFYRLADTDDPRGKVCGHDLKRDYARARSDFRKTEVDVFRLGGTRRLCFYGVRANGRYRTLGVENLVGIPSGVNHEYGNRWLAMNFFPMDGITVPSKPS